MKVALVGRDLHEVEPLLETQGLVRDDSIPEVVISNGGDGTLLGAERDYPGIPKLGLRNSKTCKKCEVHENAVVLEKLAKGDLEKTRIMKLETVCDDIRLVAVNDISLHNECVTSAVRFRVDIDGRNHSGEIIGDGLVVSTPFGSSAYYRSITHSIFQVGIGLAFNNTTEPVDHLVLEEKSAITITILRGPALAAADNDPTWVKLVGGDRFVVKKAGDSALILGIETLRCPHCRRDPEIRRPDYLDHRVRPSEMGWGPI